MTDDAPAARLPRFQAYCPAVSKSLFQHLQNQLETKLELLVVVVAAIGHVLLGYFGEAGALVRSHASENRFGDLGGLFQCIEREIRLGQ